MTALPAAHRRRRRGEFLKRRRDAPRCEDADGHREQGGHRSRQGDVEHDVVAEGTVQGQRHRFGLQDHG